MLENVAAGIVLAAILWCVRRTARWWRRRRINRSKETQQMLPNARTDYRVRQLHRHVQGLLRRSGRPKKDVVDEVTMQKKQGTSDEEKVRGRSPASIYKALGMQPQTAPKDTLVAVCLALHNSIDWGHPAELHDIEQDRAAEQAAVYWEWAQPSVHDRDEKLEKLAKALWSGFSSEQFQRPEVTAEAVAEVASSTVRAVWVEGNKVTIEVEGPTADFFNDDTAASGIFERAFKLLFLEKTKAYAEVRLVGWAPDESPE